MHRYKLKSQDDISDSLAWVTLIPAEAFLHLPRSSFNYGHQHWMSRIAIALNQNCTRKLRNFHPQPAGCPSQMRKRFVRWISNADLRDGMIIIDSRERKKTPLIVRSELIRGVIYFTHFGQQKAHFTKAAPTLYTIPTKVLPNRRSCQEIRGRKRLSARRLNSDH